MMASGTQQTHLLWTEFGDLLRGFIARRVANEADADDVLQEVFLRIHRRRDSVQRAERLDAWLFQVTRNAIADHYRAPARRREVRLDASVEPSADPAGLGNAAHGADAAYDSAQAHQELAACLRPMVERLPALHRDAVSLADLEGLTQPETAKRLGLSVSATKSRVQRGRRILKAMLQECCLIQLDAGGRVTSFEARGGSCTTGAGRCDIPRSHPSADSGDLPPSTH